MTTDLIRQSRQEMWVFTKMSLALGATISLVLWLAQAKVSWFPHGLALGYGIGSLAMLANLHILAHGFAPVIHTGRGGLVAAASSVVSLAFLGASAFLLFTWYAQGIFGFALGLVSPALVGALYAHRVLMSELRG